MSDFLFHEVSEEEKGKIKEEAKQIMDSFSKKLSRIKEKVSEPLIERDEFERKEGKGNEPDFDFRKRVFENAPNKNDDFILTEKKSWK